MGRRERPLLARAMGISTESKSNLLEQVYERRGSKETQAVGFRHC